ncbi:MAG TPA: sigma factor [Gemmatimonadales bacterium]
MPCALAAPAAQMTPAPQPSEHEVALVAGVDAAFEQLYRETADRVYGLCLRMTGDRRRASAIAQEVFVRAWKRRDWQQLERYPTASGPHESVWRLAVQVVQRERAARRGAMRLLPLLATRHLDDRTLGDMVHGPAEAGVRERALRHMSGCEQCRVRHDELRALIAAARASRAAVTVPSELWTVVAAATVYAPMVRRYLVPPPRLAFVAGGLLLALGGAVGMALLLG